MPSRLCAIALACILTHPFTVESAVACLTAGGLTAHWDPPVYVTTYVHGAAEKMEIPFVESRWAVDFYIGLADHLIGGEPLEITPESARRVIAIFELAEKSSRTGQAEPVPFED